MTGAFVRIERNGKWYSIEIEKLTDDERLGFFINRKPAEIVKWVNLLCDQINTTENLLEELVDDGVLEIQKY